MDRTAKAGGMEFTSCEPWPKPSPACQIPCGKSVRPPSGNGGAPRQRRRRDSPPISQKARFSAGFLILFLGRVYPKRVSPGNQENATISHEHRGRGGVIAAIQT